MSFLDDSLKDLDNFVESMNKPEPISPLRNDFGSDYEDEEEEERPPVFKPVPVSYPVSTAPIFIPKKTAAESEIDSLLNELDGMDSPTSPVAKKGPAASAAVTKPVAAAVFAAPPPPLPRQLQQPPKPKEPSSKDDDIDRLLDELDVKLGKSPQGSMRTTGSMSPSSSSIILAEYEQPLSPPPATKPVQHAADRYTQLLENLQADLEQLGIDETELPLEKPMKFKHLSENIDLDKLRQMSTTMQAKQEEAKTDMVSIKLYHGQACLLLRILPSADGSIILQQAIQKCGGVGPLDDFALYLVINEQDDQRRQITERMVPFDIISQVGPANCKLVLEKSPSSVSALFFFFSSFFLCFSQTLNVVFFYPAETLFCYSGSVKGGLLPSRLPGHCRGG